VQKFFIYKDKDELFQKIKVFLSAIPNVKKRVEKNKKD